MISSDYDIIEDDAPISDEELSNIASRSFTRVTVSIFLSISMITAETFIKSLQYMLLCVASIVGLVLYVLVVCLFIVLYPFHLMFKHLGNWYNHRKVTDDTSENN
jgi:Na+/glutamate symporter